MNKKGIFIPLVALFTVIILLSAFFTLVIYNENKPKGRLGEIPYSLYSVYGTAEKYLFYIDQVAKYSIEKSINDLNENGGFSEPNKYWTKESYPDSNNEFKKLFNNYFNEYMDITLDQGIYKNVLSKQNKNNYDLQIINEDLIGKAKKKLGFSGAIKGGDIHSVVDFTYYVNPDFKQKLNYDFSQYDQIKQEVDDLLKCLENKEGSIDKLIKDCGFNKEYTRNENILIYYFNDIKVKVNLGEKEVSQDKTWGQSS